MRLSSGAGWVLGAASALAILAVASVLAPLPKGAAPEAVVDVAEPVTPEVETVVPAVPAEPVVAEAAAPVAAEPVTAAEPAEAVAAAPAADTAVAEAHKLDTEAPVTAASEAAAPAAPEPAPVVVAEAPAAAEGASAAAEAGVALSSDTAPGAVPDVAPVVAAAAADAAPAAVDPLQHDTLLEPSAIPAVAPETGDGAAAAPDAPKAPDSGEAATPVVITPVPDAPVAPESPDAAALSPGGTSTLQDDKPSTLPTVGSLADRAPGEKTGGLPQIGASAEGDGDNTAGLPQVGAAAVAEAATAAPATPLAAFARPFTPIDPSKPLFVVMLRDIGAKGMAREEVARLPFAVTIVLDPLAPDAAEAMRTWRAAGQEVVMQAGGLPVGAAAADVAQSFQALAGVLPEAVAVIDADGTTFQNDRPLASLVVPVIADGGRGLVTWNEGLDAANQIATRDKVPAATIFRRLDGGGESKDTIRRYLDRAAFKAAQDGQVVVFGDTRADTVAAIVEWTVEGRSASVNMAPLTAALGRAQ